MRLSTKSLLSPSAKSLAVGVVIALGVLAFAITGISPNPSGLDTNVAAMVGGQSVSMVELQRVVENLNRQSGNEPGRREANIQSALNQLIQEKVMLEEAHRIGWHPSDQEVAQWIRRRPEFQNEKTKQFDIAIYRKFLKSGYMSELDFHKQGRDSMTLEKMSALLYLPEVTPKSILTDKALRDSTEFSLEFANVQPNPTKLKEKLVEESKKYAADAANEKNLKDAFEASKTEFVRPAQVRALSILVAHKDAQRVEGDAKSRSKDDAKKIIDDVRAKILKGESFANIAGSTNDDATAKLAKGDIGWIDSTNIDPVSSAAAFTLNKDNSLSEVLDTPFGFRLLRWQESRERLERKFEDVKGELAERALSEKIKTEMSAGIEGQINTLLGEKKFAEVNSLAEANGFEWKTGKKAITPRTRFIEDLGPSDALLPVLFGLKNKGDMAPQILDFGGRKALVRLASRKEGLTPDGDRLRRLQAADQRLSAQSYVSTMQRKLFDLYTSNKEIKRNVELLR
ncbi:MAG: SurA N-terminal domain-containing protein [Silvanigrellaceae bacterium]